jgi:glutamine amidotransferase-like uncharacterized protein
MNSRTHLTLLLLLVLPIGLLAENKPICVAIFEGDGVGPSAMQLIEAIQKAKEEPFQISRITAAEIQGGKLANVDVLVHPGGSGGNQGKALGETGRKAVRDFVQKGGGYLGICAGAYLATNDYKWSLNLIDAKVVDKRHWARGTGMVQLQLSPAGSALFHHPEPELSIHYAQGPLLARPEWDNPDVPNYESLAIFKTEIALKGAPEGVMASTSAAVRAQYGRGRVFCFSPHPELTEGLNHLIPLTVRWVAGK